MTNRLVPGDLWYEGTEILAMVIDLRRQVNDLTEMLAAHLINHHNEDMQDSNLSEFWTNTRGRSNA
jgi:hypothetical protein